MRIALLQQLRQGERSVSNGIIRIGDFFPSIWSYVSELHKQ
jgi:hypothetical protein